LGLDQPFEYTGAYEISASRGSRARGEMDLMGRIAGLWLLTAAALMAQEKSANGLASFRDAAIQRAAEWDTLSQGLGRKIARLLPCDLRVRGAIEEVSRASEVRLAALMQYLRAAAEKAKDNSAGTRMVISDQEAFTAVLNTEEAEATAERAGIEGQLLDLGESAKQRAQLAQAQKALAGIAEQARQRATQVQELAGRSTTLAASLGELDRSYQKEQAALENEINALTAETAHWGEYYAARLVRAQTECSLTNDTGASRSSPRKKQ
jgi:hypothetical protein